MNEMKARTMSNAPQFPYSSTQWTSYAFKCVANSLASCDVVYSHHNSRLHTTIEMIDRRYNMPKKWQPMTFVDYRLNTKQKKEFSGWLKDHSDDLFEMLETLLLTGHKLSVSYDDKSGSSIATVICRDTSSQNAHCCVSSRHASPLDAVGVALFKHFTILADLSWKDIDSESEWG